MYTSTLVATYLVFFLFLVVAVPSLFPAVTLSLVLSLSLYPTALEAEGYLHSLQRDGGVRHPPLNKRGEGDESIW